MTSTSTPLRFVVALVVPLVILALAALPNMGGTSTLNAANAAPVFVTNSGAAQAVPVSYPTIPTVNVGILPSVAISSLPANGTVGINNAASSPVPVRDVENPARQAVGANTSCTFPANAGTCNFTLFSVDSQHQLVIEYASAVVFMPTGQKLNFLYLFRHLNGSGISDYLAPSYEADDGSLARAMASVQMRAYADPSTDVVGTCQKNDNGPSSTACFVSFSGYLVNAP
jgi:hypothetical protein